MSESTGRQRVIDVFGDECPVCGHSVTGAHSIWERCELCGVNCGEWPWPPASVERFQAAQRSIYRLMDYWCGGCGHPMEYHDMTGCLCYLDPREERNICPCEEPPRHVIGKGEAWTGPR